MIDWAGLLGLMGPVSVGVALWVMARLSERLGRVTHARPYYRILYISAAFVWGGATARIPYLLGGLALSEELKQNTIWVLLYDGFPALGLTLGLIVVWYYWSWLLAERD